MSPQSLRVPLPPPLLFAAALGVGLLLFALRPLSLGLDELAPRLLAALPLFLASAVIGAWSLATLRRHGARPDFDHDVTTLVVDGPYRHSRNPLYVALLAILSGFALLLDNAWLALLAPVLLGCLRQLVVVREEVFLAHRVGAAYTDYRRRVRRWI